MPLSNSVFRVLCAGLEKKFKRNERKMQEQRNELTELERNVTKVREHIREQAQRYSQCT